MALCRPIGWGRNASRFVRDFGSTRAAPYWPIEVRFSAIRNKSPAKMSAGDLEKIQPISSTL
jgi:hypothetical protein